MYAATDVIQLFTVFVQARRVACLAFFILASVINGTREGHRPIPFWMAHFKGERNLRAFRAGRV
ncbi:hypothetical protein AYO27_13405 [Rhizobium sp. GHKF11]|nr:hypothetical protein AYO27_13405 [Rhizobium sp. GHKF11]